MRTARTLTVSPSMLYSEEGDLVLGGCTLSRGGCTWSWGVWECLLQGRGVYLFPGGRGCTWSGGGFCFVGCLLRGCTWSQGVYLVRYSPPPEQNDKQV